MKKKLLVLFALCLCLLAGCEAEEGKETPADTPSPVLTQETGPTDTPTPVPTATNTPTPTNTPVPTATNTPTPTPTNTPKPTPTNTPTPTGTPTPLPEPIGITVNKSRTRIEYPTPTPANETQKNCMHITTGEGTEMQLVNGKYEYFYQCFCIKCGMVTMNVLFQVEPYPTITPMPEEETKQYAMQKVPGKIVKQEVNLYASLLTVTYEDGSSHVYDRTPATYTYFENGAKYFAFFPKDTEVVFYRYLENEKGKILTEEFILKYDKACGTQEGRDTALIDSVVFYVYTCIDHATGETVSFLVNSDGSYNRYSEYKFLSSVCGLKSGWTNGSDLNNAQCESITVYSTGAKIRIDMTKPEELYYYKTDDTYPNLYDEIRLYER